MPSERLLKRIRYWGKSQGDRVSMLELGEYKNSVLSDLTALYNTKKGTVLISDEMGVPDFVSLMNSMGEGDVSAIESAFANVTRQYEPRMSEIAVKYRPRENEFGLLRFFISGKLMFRNQELMLDFFALVQSNGGVVLET